MSVEWASFCSMSNIVGEIIQMQNLIFPEFFVLFLLVSARLLCRSHSRLPLLHYVDFCPSVFLSLCLPFCFKCWIKNRKLILMCFLIELYSNHCLQEDFFLLSNFSPSVKLTMSISLLLNLSGGLLQQHPQYTTCFVDQSCPLYYHELLERKDLIFVSLAVLCLC